MNISVTCKECKKEAKFGELWAFMFNEDYKFRKSVLMTERKISACRDLEIVGKEIDDINVKIAAVEDSFKEKEKLLELKYLHNKLLFQSNHQKYLLEEISK